MGEGCEKSDKFWNAVIRQSLIARLLVKDIDNYGLLKLSPEGYKFIEEPYSIKLTMDHDYDNPEEDDVVATGGAVHKTSTTDKALFSMLKDLRKKISKDENLPPFVIFQDPSLEDMAIQYPISMEELTQITGVGAGKAKKIRRTVY